MHFLLLTRSCKPPTHCFDHPYRHRNESRLKFDIFEIRHDFHTSRLACSIVPTPTLVGREELYTQTVFFLFRQFWPIDIFIVESCEWHH